MNKNEKGITLVILVITIILLLILTTVTISYTIGGDGIIFKSKEAKFKDEVLELQYTLEKQKTVVSTINSTNNYEIEEIESRLQNSATRLWDKYDSILDIDANGSFYYIKENVSPEEKIWLEELGIMPYIEKILKDETQIKDQIGPKGYIGYYADVDGNGTVDGVIYADLAVGVTEQWENNSGNYSYDTISNLKEYIISQENYEGDFGTKPVLKAVGSKGVDRFYVMALNDVAEDGTSTARRLEVSTWKWWNGKELDKSMSILKEEENSNDFGKGKSKTQTMITKWLEKPYPSDYETWRIFKYANNTSGTLDGTIWFVPSKGEWSAFAKNLNITRYNYGNMGLSWAYWSTSIKDIYLRSIFCAYFSYGEISETPIDLTRFVRLSANF